MNQGLIDEGLAREVINRIQKTRKDLDFQINDRIKVTYSASEELAAAIAENSDYISRETLSLELISGSSSENAVSYKIEDYELNVSLEVVK